MLYQFIINCLGYQLYKKENVDNLPLDIENGTVIIHEIRETKIDRILFFMKILYNLIIISLISWSVLYSLILSIEQKDISIIGRNSFQIIFTSQYVIGLLYFNNDHLDSIMMKYLEIKNNILKLIPFALLGSLIFTIMITIIVSYHNKIPNALQYIYNVSLVLTFIQNFFSYFTFFVNTTIFTIIILNHKNKIVIKTNKIKEHIKSSVIFEGKISGITLDIVRLRDEYNESVEQLNPFFASLSILTLIYFSFLIGYEDIYNFSPIDWINLSIFLVIIYIYINSAQKLRSSIDNIANIITRSIYTNDCFGRMNKIEYDSKQNHDNDNIHETIIDMHICISSMYENMAIINLQKVIELQWNTFQIFGIQITDTGLIQKVFSILIVITISSNLQLSIFGN